MEIAPIVLYCRLGGSYLFSSYFSSLATDPRLIGCRIRGVTKRYSEKESEQNDEIEKKGNGLGSKETR